MAVNNPCYLLKKGSGYYSRIKIPKDLKLRFSRRSEYKGHAGNEGNERCDNWASKAASGSTLLKDDIYERNNN